MRKAAAEIAIFAFLALADASAEAIDLLVPGISLGSVALVKGAMVSYLVVTESFGASDSSWVQLEVLSRAGGEIKLQVSTAPYPPRRSEIFTVRLQLSEKVVSISSPDEFKACVRSIRVREGLSAFREPTKEELDEMAIEDLFLRRGDDCSKSDISISILNVPAGTFECSGLQTNKRSERNVSLGGVSALRIEEEITRIWLSQQVPLWGLVKSRMERKTSIRRSGSSETADRLTIVESMLIDFRNPKMK